MIGRSRHRFLLVNYSGYAEYMEYLYMENGLAYLAGILQRDGHLCRIFDYMTLGMAERLFPVEHLDDIERYRARGLAEIAAGRGLEQGFLDEVRGLEAEIDVRNRRVTRNVATEIVQAVRERGVECVGFKLWSQPSLVDAFFIAEEVRRACPGVMIVGGGPHVDFFMELACEAAPHAFDLFVYGDGEIAVRNLPALLDGALRKEEIPNLIFRGPEGVVVTPPERVSTLDVGTDLAFDHETYPAAQRDDEKVKLVPVENARGCNYQCGFCIHPIKSGRYREKPPQEFLDEVLRLKARYGFINFYAAGSNTSHRNCVANLALAHDRGDGLFLSFFQSARDFDFGSEELLRRSNVGFFWIGVETGSQELAQEAIRNKKTVAQTKAVCALLRDIGIRTYTSYIFPLPGATASAADETLELIEELGSEWVVIYPPLLQPRTPWFLGSSPHVRLLDRDAFLRASMFGIEEVDNKVLPRVITDEALAGSLLINDKPYRETYYEYLRFKRRHEPENPFVAHSYARRACAGRTPRERLYALTDDMTHAVMQALVKGRFEESRPALRRYNAFCTSGEVTPREERRR